MGSVICPLRRESHGIVEWAHVRGRGQEERRGHGAPLASRRDAATGGDADAQAPLRQTEVEVHRLLEHVLVEVEAELSGAQGAELPEHDVLGETVHAVAL